MSLEEKRQEYKCGNTYVTLSEIPPWSKSGRAEESSVSSAINEKISIFSGDITKLEIDAIVNAANSRLAGGGGGTVCLIVLSTTYFLILQLTASSTEEPGQ